MGAAKGKRVGLSKSRRFEIFKRDGFTCQYCGAHPPAVVLHVDHIVPVAEGGLNDEDNLVTACQPCNAGKSDRPLSNAPMALKDKAAATQEAEAQLRGYHDVMELRRKRINADAWLVSDIFVDHFADDSIRKDWFQSIKMFNEKLGAHECMAAMEAAVAKCGFNKDHAFRYFCGICWSKIKEVA